MRLGANPNLTANISVLIALHLAVTDNQYDIVRHLLSHGADCALEPGKGQLHDHETHTAYTFNFFLSNTVNTVPSFSVICRSA